jgi:hypothetical protein
MKFVDEKRPVDKSKDVVPLKRGIYKPVPVTPMVKTPVATPATKKPKPQAKKPVQFSSQKKAVKYMNKAIKAKQKRGPGAGVMRSFNRK